MFVSTLGPLKGKRLISYMLLFIYMHVSYKVICNCWVHLYFLPLAPFHCFKIFISYSVLFTDGEQFLNNVSFFYKWIYELLKD